MANDFYTIGIAGGSGSGKTTLINKIRERFDKTKVCIISQDNYYRPREEQFLDEKGVRNFDLPSSLDLEAFYDDIVFLINGGTVKRKEYTFNNAAKDSKIIVMKPAPVIIAEGLFTFASAKLKNIYDLKIMIDASDDRKIIRRIKRDRMERNYPLEDVLYRYEYHVTPAYNKYIEPHKEDADIIINNNKSFDQALEVLVSFIQSKTQ